jgi:hypothetical protein
MPEQMTVDKIRVWYNQTCGTLLDGKPVHRWGSFDRDVVGVLLAEIDRLNEELRQCQSK